MFARSPRDSLTPIFAVLLLGLATLVSANFVPTLARRQDDSGTGNDTDVSGDFAGIVIDTPCRPICHDYSLALKTCPRLRCLCRPVFLDALVSCLDCVTALNRTSAKPLQAIVSDIVAQCTAADLKPNNTNTVLTPVTPSVTTATVVSTVTGDTTTTATSSSSASPSTSSSGAVPAHLSFSLGWFFLYSALGGVAVAAVAL